MKALLAALALCGLMACGDSQSGGGGDGGAHDSAVAADAASTADARVIDAQGTAPDAAASSCATLSDCCARLNIPEFKPHCLKIAAGGDPGMCATEYNVDSRYCP